MSRLTQFVRELRVFGRGTVADFDPLDGGEDAKALFLFEKPGPMTDLSREGLSTGSGFISRDNDDPTAETIFRFMRSADIPRRSVVIWNVIPWWNGTRGIRKGELEDGLAALDHLIELLPHLRVVVLVGRRAGHAMSAIKTRQLPVLVSAHPSPVVRASRRALWDSIPDQWARVAPYLEEPA